MDGAFYGWIEIVLTFGGLLAFCAWQWWDVRQARKAREEAQRNGRE